MAILIFAFRTVMRRLDIHVVLLSDDHQGGLVRWKILHHLFDGNTVIHWSHHLGVLLAHLVVDHLNSVISFSDTICVV